MGKRKRIQKTGYELVKIGKKKIVTGIPDIDKFMSGGYKKGELAIIAPPTGQSKSSFMHDMLVKNKQFDQFVKEQLNGKGD